MSPGKRDARVLSRHLSALDSALQQLRQHQGRPASLLAENRDELWIIERGLLLCCQNALDVATHLVATAGRDVGGYTQAIDALADLGVLPRDFAQAFRGIGGLRNALVHGYLGIDGEILHQVLNQRLGEFEQFAEYVRVYVTSYHEG